jgi:hypothetical protein
LIIEVFAGLALPGERTGSTGCTISHRLQQLVEFFPTLCGLGLEPSREIGANLADFLAGTERKSGWLKDT